ncbi:hypothetical protein HY995_00240 [Candidatus Micrarchaeota archaeon]|nr:hypothetical protein [Candidatus Micrarchaeota archaeon]
MPPGIVKSANEIRRNNERLLAIFFKLAGKLGGFDALRQYGLNDDEINFLKEEFPK